MANEHNNAPAVPQGWKLVPIEPTKEMLDAGLKRKAQARWIDGASVLRSRNENLRPAEEIAALQWEAMLATTPAPAPSKGAVGFGARVLAAELAEAALKDDNDPEGHDISAGLFGPNVSAWLRKVASEYLAPAPAPSGFAKALDIRISQGWKLTGNTIPVLYTDTINGDQVMRDDVWLCTTSALEVEAHAPAQEVGLTEAERVMCLIASGCIGTVKMTYDSGPYEITRTSINASRLIDAIIAALRAKGEK